MKPISHISRHAARWRGFTLVEIMIVVFIIGILLTVAAPNFIRAREAARAKSCVGNLKQIESATQQYCMDNKYGPTVYVTPTLDTTAGTGLVGANAYLRTLPVCQSGGAYLMPGSIGAIPTCNIPITNSSDTNYTSSGIYFHGL